MLKNIWARLPQKWQELASYGFFGVLTTAVNYAVYAGCTRLIHLNYMTANAAAWIVAVLFAYFTNKAWVFRSRDWSAAVLAREMLSFIGARLFSGLVDIAGLALLVSVLGMNDLIGKLIVNVVAVILNYVLSKLLVFRGQRTDNR